MAVKVDEWKRATRNAEQRASARMLLNNEEWPVLVVRLRLVSPFPEEIAHYASIKHSKKKWSRRHQLRRLVEIREQQDADNRKEP
jgi:hypothetical protein